MRATTTAIILPRVEHNCSASTSTFCINYIYIKKKSSKCKKKNYNKLYFTFASFCRFGNKNNKNWFKNTCAIFKFFNRPCKPHTTKHTHSHTHTHPHTRSASFRFFLFKMCGFAGYCRSKKSYWGSGEDLLVWLYTICDFVAATII